MHIPDTLTLIEAVASLPVFTQMTDELEARAVMLSSDVSTIAPSLVRLELTRIAVDNRPCCGVISNSVNSS